MTLTLPTRRDFRLGSGLVLFTYVASHLANHALGLVSVALAEHGLNIAVRVWHSVPGTLLLYGAVSTHVTLALTSIYMRRTLRMPPIEVLRIALGLGIPILLIGHAVATRLAWEAYRLPPEYARTVWSLWQSDSEGRQLALLVPGWLHGCLGVNFAFGRRAWYQRVRPVLFAVALLLPVLGGLGFLAMGKELAADVANRTFLDDNIAVDAATRLSLARTRDTLVAVWFALIGAVFVARAIRGVVERSRNSAIAISYPQRVARVPAGWTVLEASRSHHIPHVSMCGGQARCSTCRVRVVSGESHCPPAAENERATLDRIGAAPDVRLACQLRPTGDIGVVPLLAAGPLAAGADQAGAIDEREVVVLQVAWRNRAVFARSHLPQDVVYLSRLFVETVAGTLDASGGTVGETNVDGVTAVFGLTGGIDGARRRALDAAGAIDAALDGLRRRYAALFGAPADFAVIVHQGHGAIGEGSGRATGSLLAAGEAFDTLAALRSADVGADAAIVVSASALGSAATPRPGATAALPWRDVTCRDGAPPLRVAVFGNAAHLRSALASG